MNDNSAISALQRKAGAGRPPPEPSALSPGSLMRKAVAQAAEDLQEMVAAVVGFGESRATLTELVEGLTDTTLLMSLSAADGRRGLAIVDVQIVTAVVEYLTTGRIVPKEAQDRRPTRTDAVMVSDFLDRTLGRFDDALTTLPDPPPVAGFRYSSVLVEPRVVQMALEDVSYRLYRLRIDLGRGARTGEVTLAFPFERSRGAGSGPVDIEGWQKDLNAVVMQSEAPVRAVLHRVLMPLSQIARWTSGQVLEIPAIALSSVELEGIDGRVAATGRLGQVNGYRALRLQTTGDPPPRPKLAHTVMRQADDAALPADTASSTIRSCQ